MADSYDSMAGSEMDVRDHPDNSHDYRDDMTPPDFNPKGPFGQRATDRQLESLKPFGSNPHGSIDARGQVHGM